LGNVSVFEAEYSHGVMLLL